MNDKNINELPDNERYEYLINYSADNKEIWLLKAFDGMYAMFEDNNGQEYMPVWPEQKYAEQYAADDWDGYVPDKMEAYEFINWMQELKDDKIIIAAFPNSNSRIIPIDPLDIKKHLTEQLKR